MNEMASAAQRLEVQLTNSLKKEVVADVIEDTS